MNANHIKQKAFGMVTAGAVALLSVCPAFALTSEPLNETESASLTVYFEVSDEKIEGAEIDIYRVASLATSGEGAYAYDLTGNDIDYDGMTASESNETAEDLLEEDLSDFYVDSGETDENGSVVFEDLEFGIYLVALSEAAGDDETQYYFEPFLVSVPLWEIEGGSYVWEYDVETYPKSVSSETIITEETEETVATTTVTNTYVTKKDGDTYIGGPHITNVTEGDTNTTNVVNEGGTTTTTNNYYGDFVQYVTDTITSAFGGYKTGDSSNMMLWLAILAAGILAAAGVVIYRKKKKTA